jgi:hypothetical protein
MFERRPLWSRIGSESTVPLMAEKCHVWTAPCWRGFFFTVQLVGCGHVFGLFAWSVTFMGRRELMPLPSLLALASQLEDHWTPGLSGRPPLTQKPLRRSPKREPPTCLSGECNGAR